MKIAVVTPTIPGREQLLLECSNSVKEQNTKISLFHAVELDRAGVGCGTMRNHIVASLSPDYNWVAFIDDDDLMLPYHVQSLVDFSEDHDLIYADCITRGWTKSWVTGPLDIQRLSERNYIPVTVLIRRSTFENAGGFHKCFAEDWDLWKRMAQTGARFRYVSKVTWIYRQVPGISRMLVRGY